MRMLAISGSARRLSTNTYLLKAFARNAPGACEIELYAELDRLPVFNPDREHDTPHEVRELAGRIARCRGIVIAAPEYAHGISGGLKNALDWLVSRSEIPGKPVMLVHGSSRSHVSRAHLREVLTTMSCRLSVAPEFEIHLIGKTTAEIDDSLDAPAMRRRMNRVLADFIDFIETVPEAG